MSEQLSSIGYVIRTHGVKGHVRIRFNENIKELSKKEALYFLVRGVMLPFFIEEVEYFKDGDAIIKLEEFNSMEQAGLYTKREVFGPADYLLHAEEDSTHEYFDFRVFDEQLGELGNVSAVMDMGDYELIEVLYGDKELMIPLHADTFVSADMKSRILHIRLPEGLINL